MMLLPIAALLVAPKHVLTFLYYGQSFGRSAVNARLSPAFMAEHADFVEASGFDHRRVAAFKAAGGRFAGAYVDPTYVPYCVPPFAAPAGACAGPIGDLDPAEAAWFHDAAGARAHRADAYTNQYQEFLDPAAAQARRAVVTWMDRYLASSPQLDFFFADDTGSTLRGPAGTPESGMFYGFSAPGVEISGDAAWIAGENALIASAPRPLVLNGGDGFAPAYGGEFLRNPNVAGSNHEGCFNSAAAGGRVGDARGAWTGQVEGLLADLPFRKYSLCMMNGPPTPENRLYALASWWLTYDERYSVAAPIAPAADGNAVFAEEAIVPLRPEETAHGTDLAALVRGGVYAREFAACYQEGRSIGRCAAVVNPAGSARALPVLRHRYRYRLALDGASLASGGRATWIPIRGGSLAGASLGARGAVIVKQ